MQAKQEHLSALALTKKLLFLEVPFSRVKTGSMVLAI